MSDFMVRMFTDYPWFGWLVAVLAVAGAAYAGVWFADLTVTVSSWLGYRRLVWKSKSAVRRHVVEGGCPSCTAPDEAVKAADAAGRDRALSVRCPMCGVLPGYRCLDERTARPTNLMHGTRVLAWADTFGTEPVERDDPPEYQHPDGDDDEFPPEPDESAVLAFLAAVKSMGLLNDDDQLPDGPPVEGEIVPRCEDPECDKYGWVHPAPCLILPTMPVPVYRDGPAMPPQPWSGLAASLEVLARGDDDKPLHPAIQAHLETAGFAVHDSSEAIVESAWTKAQTLEVQAMIADTVIPTNETGRSQS